MTESSPQLEIWTDGACKGNPGVGGWGAYLRWGEETLELFGGERMTTNNRMELTAVISALSVIVEPYRETIVIYTDSQYVKDGITSWIRNWKKKNWKGVKNPELWQRLDELASRFAIDWRWVRGHNGDPGNEKADELANRGVDSALGKCEPSLP